MDEPMLYDYAGECEMHAQDIRQARIDERTEQILADHDSVVDLTESYWDDEAAFAIAAVIAAKNPEEEALALLDLHRVYGKWAELRAIEYYRKRLA
jgi:hypothetical protein